MPFIQRFSDVKKGGISFTGNTLGLSKAPNLNAPGTEGSIGAFTSLNNALQVGTFPAGTTLSYLQNGSRTTLNLPAGSAVLYAELIWGGLYRSSANDISALTNNSVIFTTALGAFTVAPDPLTAQNFNIPADNITVGFYIRSADVTALVQSATSQTYQITKSADKTFADVGEEITYTLVLENTDAVEALNVTVSDLLPPETTLVDGSVTVDGVNYPAYNPQTGFFAANLTPQASVTVTFQVQVN